ncbi:hypothetical protein M0802_003129 [Mischocyttarus mexicanus]|nr:hypothetical protein M0802_003129 [Mischocyttarus mexicanus]
MSSSVSQATTINNILEEQSYVHDFQSANGCFYDGTNFQWKTQQKRIMAVASLSSATTSEISDLFNLPIGALWTVVVGEWELDSGGRGSARLPVDRVILHERFNNYVHDIALMKLARPAPLSKVVKTICLPDAEEELTDSNCVASGWGRYGPSPSLSTALLEASVPLLNLEECLHAYGKSVPILNGHLCAGHTDGSSGSCVGDSGGPLQCRRSDGVWQLVGVTSFGSGCARPGYPDVYTRIQHYLNWIKNIIDNDNNI